MATGRAVRDHRAAADESLETRNAAGRVDDRVGRREQRAHRICEAEDDDTRLVGEALLEAAARVLVPPADADDRHAGEAKGRGDGAVEVADAPAAAGDENHRPLRRKTEVSPRDRSVVRGAESRHDERVDRPGAPGAGDALDALTAALVHDEVEIDAAVCPERVDAEVGYRRDDRYSDLPEAPQAPEHRGQGGKRRDDDVGLVHGDERKQAARSQESEPEAAQGAERCDAGEEEVRESVEPRREPKLRPVAVAQEAGEEGAESTEAIRDRHVSVLALGLDFDGERAGGRDMTFADIGGKDQDADARALAQRCSIGIQPVRRIVTGSSTSGTVRSLTRRSRSSGTYAEEVHMFFHSAEEPQERAADPARRRANLRGIGRLFAPYKARLGGLLLLIIVAAALGVVPAFLLKRALEAIVRNDTTALSLAAGGMIAIAVVTGVLGVIQTLLSNQVGQRVMHDLRAAVFRHLQQLSLAFFTRTRTGEVQSRISNDIGGVQNVVTNTATSIASSVTTVVATIVGMLVLSWQLTLFAVALIPFFVLLTRRVGNERRRIAKTTQETLADISSLVQESLSVSGILLGKTMGRGNELADRFEADSRRLADLEVRERMAGRWVMASIQTSFAVMPAAVYWFGGFALAHGSHSISIATLVAFTTLQTRLFFPVGSLLGVGLDVQTSLALFDRIFDYLDQPIDVVEKPNAIPVAKAGDVVFDHVWFRYGEGWTLEDVSFVVPAGTTTALVGETGSGKTTLGYLVARLYDATSGRISIGGVDIRDLSFQALSDLVGVVSQETYLFHASVRDNLRFAKPDATDAEIEEAAEAARIHDLISALPDGYDTVVGERGYRFSGGEKQRIAIARTILRNPPILVLDEATSSLDTETERLVQEALDRLSQGRTTIAIAHRLSTIRDADQIVVLDRGRIVESGRHDELIRAGGRYSALVSRDAVLATSAPRRDLPALASAS